MGAAWLTLRADLRRRWRPMLGLVLLIGLVSGVVLVAAAGARRTSTAYPRLLRWASAAQLDLVPGQPRAGYTGSGRTGYYAAVARLPQVASVSAVDLLGMAVQPPHGPPDLNINTTGSLDAATGRTVNRVRVLAGRLYDPADPHAVMIDQRMARLAHVGPGGTLHVLAIPGFTSAHPDLRGEKRLALRVSAIVRFADGIVPDNAGSAEPRALFSPAFVRQYVAGRYPWLAISDYAGIRLQPGASLASFTQAARSLARQYPATRGTVDVVSLADASVAVQRAIRPEVVALAAFAALAGLIGLVILAQLLARQVSLDAVDYPILRALGASRGTLTRTSLLRVGVLTLGGGLLGVGLAVAASPLMPIGLARLAEPDPGVEVNLAILGAGLAVAAIAPLLLVFPTAWRAASPAAGPPGLAEPAYAGRPSRLGSALGMAGSVTGGLGVRMALEPGRGRTAVPVRSALAGTAVAVAALVAATVFGTSLLGLVGAPHRYGQNWTQDVNFMQPSAPATLVARLIATQPLVRGYAVGNFGIDRGERPGGARDRRHPGPRARLPDPDLRAAAPAPGRDRPGPADPAGGRGPAGPAGQGQRQRAGGPAAGGRRGGLPVLHRKRVFGDRPRAGRGRGALAAVHPLRADRLPARPDLLQLHPAPVSAGHRPEHRGPQARGRLQPQRLPAQRGLLHAHRGPAAQ